MSNQKPSFRFQIDNFSEKETNIVSNNFVSGGCDWDISVYPKGDRICDDHLCLFLHVANHKSLRTGWKRTANFHFVVLNQSEQELYRSSIAQAPLFCAETPSWGFRETIHLSKFQELGFLAKDSLIIEVYIQIVEVVDGEVEEDLSEKKSIVINGFLVSPSKVTLVRKIFAEHPDIAEDFKPNNQAVKSAYMNVLIKLIKKLEKPPKSLNYMTLRKASSELTELIEVGFKLDWLKLKFEEVSLEKAKAYADRSLVQTLVEHVKNLGLMESSSLERKKADADASHVQKLEERIKNLELMESGYKLECLKTKLEELYSEKKKADAYGSHVQNLKERVKNLELMESSSLKRIADADGSHFQKLEERVKKLELMESGYKLDCLKTKLEELYSEKKKEDADGSHVQNLEERVKNLELMECSSKINSLNLKLAEVSLERKNDASLVQSLKMDLNCFDRKLNEVSLFQKKSDEDLRKKIDKARIQRLEETVTDLKMMVSSLKVELDKKEDKSYDDEFLLVENVD